MDTNRSCMPEEILFDILTMLPVKSLCRFRCVSKLWFSIIANPDFVTAHLVRSPSRPKLLISFFHIGALPSYSGRTYFSVDYPQRDLIARATFNSSTDNASSYIVSPSLGLICFTCSNSDSKGIKIQNPITGDVVLIPYPVSGITYEKSFFGFDPIGKRHVILMLEKLQGYPYTSCGKSRVYDLAENRWYDTCPHPYFYGGGNSSICIDGVIYFTTRSSISRSMVECLYAYDVRLKRFQMIQRIPDSVKGRLLIEYKGRVALGCQGDLHDDEIRLWILEDPDTHIWSFESFVVPWRQNLARDGISIDSLDRYSFKVKFFGATHRGELILATELWRGSLYLFFYEMETNTLRRFQVDGFGASFVGLDVRFNIMVESLLSPKGFKEEEEEENCSLP